MKIPKGTYAIVLCGGWGTLDKKKSKLLEKVSYQKEMIPLCHVPYLILKEELGIEETLVVVNGHYGDEIKKTFPTDSYALIQPIRSGTAGAIEICFAAINHMEANGHPKCKNLIILYGDMPCWQANSIAKLVRSHTKRKAAMSMFSIATKHKLGYGRILRNSNGNIIAIKEPWQMTAEDLKNTKTENPSAWVLDFEFAKANIPHLGWHCKGDGYPKEKWLPDLAAIATVQTRIINEVSLTNYRQAMGVNSIAEYKKVKKYLER